MWTCEGRHAAMTLMQCDVRHMNYMTLNRIQEQNDVYRGIPRLLGKITTLLQIAWTKLPVGPHLKDHSDLGDAPDDH